MASRVLAENNIDFLCIDQKKEIGKPLKCGEGIREKEFLDFFGHKNFDFIENTAKSHDVITDGFRRTINYGLLQLNRPKFEKFLAKRVKKNIIGHSTATSKIIESFWDGVIIVA